MLTSSRSSGRLSILKPALALDFLQSIKHILTLICCYIKTSFIPNLPEYKRTNKNKQCFKILLAVPVTLAQTVWLFYLKMLNSFILSFAHFTSKIFSKLTCSFCIPSCQCSNKQLFSYFSSYFLIITFDFSHIQNSSNHYISVLIFHSSTIDQGQRKGNFK